MALAWVVAGVLLWVLVMVILIALCRSVGHIDGRLGMHRDGRHRALEARKPDATPIEIE